MTDKNLGRRETAEIVRDVGGRIVGRTRLQKVAYLLELAGFGVGFHFEYRHFGPYCEELAEGMRAAQAFGLIEEEERPTEWEDSILFTGHCPKLESKSRTIGLSLRVWRPRSAPLR